MLKLNQKISNTEFEEIYDYQIDSDYVEQKIIDQADRLRRINLTIYGILETPEQTWEDCREKLKQVFQERLDLEFPIEIE